MASNEGDRFRDDVAAFLRAAWKDVDVEVLIGHKRVDIVWNRQDFGNKSRVIAIECKKYARALSLEEVTVIWADYSALYDNRQVDEIWLITSKDISPAAKNYVNSVRALTYLTFPQLQNSIFNVRAYLRNLKTSFEDEGIERYYVASHCDTGIEAIEHISNWIKTKGGPALAVLASYGMGKTTTARKIAATLAKAHLANEEGRIPIYVQLQEIVGEQSLEGLLGKVLAARAPIDGYHFDTFMTLNKSGRFLVILDGFDEMKHAMTWDDFRATFKELNRLVTPEAKVLLLGRPTAFLSDDEETFVLKGLRTLAGRQIREPDWPSYQTIKLLPFSAEQSADFVKSYSGFRIQNSATDDYIIDAEELERRTEILESHDFGDLLSRPVQAKMFCEMFLDKFVSPRPYLTGELYEIFVQRIIEREIDKRPGSPFGYAARRKFAEAIAWWLWTTAQTMSIDENQIPDEIVKPFAPNAEIEPDAVRRDLVSACFLERKGNKTLFFPHRSFQEFLVACYMVKNEIDDMNVIFAAATRDVSRFVSEIPEGAATFARWHRALPHYTGTIPLHLLRDIVRSMKDQGKQRPRVQCPWDVAIQFLISCGGDDEPITVKLIALDAAFKASSFFEEYYKRSICIDVLLVAIAHATSDFHSVISDQIFGFLVNHLQLRLGKMPGAEAVSRFSPSRYLNNSDSDPYWHVVRRSFSLTPAEGGSIEARYTPHELLALIRAQFPLFRIIDIEGLERVPEQIIRISADRTRPHVAKNRLNEALAALGSTG
ncbi:NACHT domain-containing protein [Bradyrhizobium sp. 40]|uniref:NACHT domain-containing protein n=1 Tax=Bradyrhizobium sp. 40 TaxID=2782674 RepID=UPI00200034DB|nr:NACHT domain-containing protein [Bradyrhizobium sp. 40]UPJ40722.1 NACHT domain-containing protein [Bradyrhizobium sp. 40]